MTLTVAVTVAVPVIRAGIGPVLGHQGYEPTVGGHACHGKRNARIGHENSRIVVCLIMMSGGGANWMDRHGEETLNEVTSLLFSQQHQSGER